MKYVLESLVVIGVCTILFCISALTFCFLALTPPKNRGKKYENRYDEPPLETWEW